MEFVDAKDYDRNPTLDKLVESDNDLKSFLVEYVGNRVNPEDNNVTVEMIVESMAKEFPDFIFAVAEENWVRGYQQALDDVEIGRKIAKEKENKIVKQKSFELSEEEE